MCQLRTQVTDLERFIDFLQKGLLTFSLFFINFNFLTFVFTKKGGNNKEKHKHLLAQAQTPNSKFAQMSKFLKMSRSQGKSDAANNKSDARNSKDSSSIKKSASSSSVEKETASSVLSAKAAHGKSNGQSTSNLTNGGDKRASANERNKMLNGSTAESAKSVDDEPNESATTIMNRIMSLLHVFALTQLGGCASFGNFSIQIYTIYLLLFKC